MAQHHAGAMELALRLNVALKLDRGFRTTYMTVHYAESRCFLPRPQNDRSTSHDSTIHHNSAVFLLLLKLSVRLLRNETGVEMPQKTALTLLLALLLFLGACRRAALSPDSLVAVLGNPFKLRAAQN
jgi:hypothetical protein